MKVVNCPQCGSKINYQVDDKMLRCDYCHSSLVLEAVSKKIALQIPLNSKLLIHRQRYHIENITQWLYSEGIRAEYLLINDMNQQYVLSKDDENVSLVKVVDFDKKSSNKSLDWNSLQPNTDVIINDCQWLVTEKRRMIGYANKEFFYTYLTGKNAELLIFIFSSLTEDSLLETRQGFWLNSFDIKLKCNK